MGLLGTMGTVQGCGILVWTRLKGIRILVFTAQFWYLGLGLPDAWGPERGRFNLSFGVLLR